MWVSSSFFSKYVAFVYSSMRFMQDEDISKSAESESEYEIPADLSIFSE
jgi:hypothetical protein